jgi:hypothetical protein
MPAQQQHVQRHTARAAPHSTLKAQLATPSVGGKGAVLTLKKLQAYKEQHYKQAATKCTNVCDQN